MHPDHPGLRSIPKGALGGIRGWHLSSNLVAEEDQGSRSILYLTNVI